MTQSQNTAYAVSIDALFTYPGYSFSEAIDAMREDVRADALLNPNSVELVCVDNWNPEKRPTADKRDHHQYRTAEETRRDTSSVVTNDYEEQYETEQTFALAIDNLYPIEAASEDEAMALFRDKLENGAVLDPTEIFIVPVDVWEA